MIEIYEKRGYYEININILKNNIGEFHKIPLLIENMKKYDIQPNKSTFNNLISLFSKQNDILSAELCFKQVFIY